MSGLKTDGGPWVSPRRDVNLAECYFYHTFELPDGRVIDGAWDLRGRFSDYIGRLPVAGARVLDVGAASGFLSFSAEAAGASEVVSFDLDTARRQHVLPFWGSLYVRDHEKWVAQQSGAFESWKNAYWYVHQATNSRARVAYGDVYALPEGIGTFDVVILGSILEHLADPVRAIGSIATVADSHIVVTTDTIEGDEPMALFKGRPNHPDRDYIFWTYTVETYRMIFEICGYEIERVRHDAYLSQSPLLPEQGQVNAPRTTLVARRVKPR